MTDVYKFTAENRPTGSGLASTQLGSGAKLSTDVGSMLEQTMFSYVAFAATMVKCGTGHIYSYIINAGWSLYCQL